MKQLTCLNYIWTVTVENRGSENPKNHYQLQFSSLVL